MSDSRKDRRDFRDGKGKAMDKDKGRVRRNRFDDEEDFDWHKYTGNIKDIKLDIEGIEEDND